MAIIYTYPTKTTPSNNDLLIITDSEDENKTKQVRISDLPSGGASSGVSSITLTTGASNGTPLTITPSGGTGTVNLTSRSYGGGTNVGYVPTGGSATTFLKGDGTWGTPIGTSYTAGNGLELTGTAFSADLKANGGIVFDNTELAIDLSASAIGGSLGVANGGTGASTFTAGFLKADGINAFTTVTGINLATEVSGILPITNGGTGLSSYSPGDILYYNGSTGAIAKLSMGSAQAGQVLTAGGSSPNFVPTWTNAGTGQVSRVHVTSPITFGTGSTITEPVIDIGQIPIDGHLGDANDYEYTWLSGDGINGTWKSPAYSAPLPTTMINSAVSGTGGGLTNLLFMYTFFADATHAVDFAHIFCTGNATSSFIRIGIYDGALGAQGALLKSTASGGISTAQGYLKVPLANLPSGGQKYIEAGRKYTMAFHVKLPANGTGFGTYDANTILNSALVASSTLANTEELPANLPSQSNLLPFEERIACHLGAT